MNKTSGPYLSFVQRLSRRVTARLNEIETIYNFDFGDEFEVAVCHLLSDILPEKFGICRGFVVSHEGKQAGDDIVIFDRLSYPRLRSSLDRNFAIKEQVPIEAVYATIECKHSVKDVETLDKAFDQVAAIKSLILSREENPNENYEKEGPVYNGKTRDWPRSFPRLKNQPFCLIFSRHTDAIKIGTDRKGKYVPDLVVLGENMVLTQTVNLGADGIKAGLFFDDEYFAPLAATSVPETAFGIAIVTLMQALSWIQLLPVNWAAVLNDEYLNVLLNKDH